jgi:uncharacterized membrane protein (UPF0136 family)
MIQMRSITPAQVVAVVAAVVSFVVAFGVDLTQRQQDAILNLATVLSATLIAGDAVIRLGRSRVAAAAVANGSAQIETKG